MTKNKLSKADVQRNARSESDRVGITKRRDNVCLPTAVASRRMRFRRVLPPCQRIAKISTGCGLGNSNSSRE